MDPKASSPQGRGRNPGIEVSVKPSLAQPSSPGQMRARLSRPRGTRHRTRTGRAPRPRPTPTSQMVLGAASRAGGSAEGKTKKRATIAKAARRTARARARAQDSLAMKTGVPTLARAGHFTFAALLLGRTRGPQVSRNEMREGSSPGSARRRAVASDASTPPRARGRSRGDQAQLESTALPLTGAICACDVAAAR